MKRAMKLWSILLVLVMVLCMMPARILNAQADEIVWTKVGKGTKVLDLNGHRLYLSDQGNAPAQSVMMVIPEGASLNVYDDVGTGMIWMDGQMKFGNDFYGDDAILVRDVFAVTGGLLEVHGGEIHAGRAKRVWCNFVSQNTLIGTGATSTAQLLPTAAMPPSSTAALPSPSSPARPGSTAASCGAGAGTTSPLSPVSPTTEPVPTATGTAAPPCGCWATARPGSTTAASTAAPMPMPSRWRFPAM